MKVRAAAAVMGGKSAAVASRLMRRGGGTAMPGLVAERIDPDIVADLGRQLERGRVLVTGTNGKTTTSRVLASILHEAGVPFLHNREGSNLMRGIASELLSRANVTGAIPGAPDMLGLFETDEATLPAAARALQPSILVFTNLFRDQLDRYGEVDTVAGFWRQALASTPPGATLVLNADDPSVAELAQGWTGPVHWYGIDEPAFAVDKVGASDARWCRECGGSFLYDRRYFAHVGWWRCSGCERRRADPATEATAVQLELEWSRFQVSGVGDVEMPLAGLYNVSNALAAVAAAKALLVPAASVVSGLGNVRAAFGRQEVAELEGRRLRIMLVKNPAGANQVLLLLSALREPAKLKVAALLNDRFADGQDVSWIWDADHELISGRVEAAWAGGDRAADMALRMTYAGWAPPLSVVNDPAQLLDAILAGTAPGDDVFVIPTYTAMLDLRAELARRGAVKEFWREP